MKLYVYNITQSEKMVYLSCVRYIKENDKYNIVPSSVSVRKENFHIKTIKFPFIVEVSFHKGIGAVVNPYEESKNRS